ncbi:GerMN domain-containing protein [Limnoraphis robusta Tam1]|uniref:GerMN domain-containing protein n=1 Tax=Limnoraphis robusta TaxID=1118279 RepID=UPI002B1F22D0|nr:GerMN domain-containing protein [Limnoraphis robusta]MEA5497717.1 GerMN domain-containing protein [Limnoraphis robusta BA-68 BA1]MEA5538065.1 GerMN domain-containing protein [Limnoraphis robusta Tam1]
MRDPMQENTKPVGMIAAIAALLIAVGGGITWWTLSTRQTEQPDVVSPVPSPIPGETSQPSPLPPPSAEQPGTVEKTVEIYRVQDQNGQIEWVATPVTVEVSEDDPGVVLEAAFRRLLAQPTDENRFSEIPPQTQLLSVQAYPSEVYVNLSPEFTTGGGSASMIGRLGQVIYTASSLNPDAKVWISVGGQPLEILGGEGLEVPQPATRKNFEAEFQSN